MFNAIMCFQGCKQQNMGFPDPEPPAFDMTKEEKRLRQMFGRRKFSDYEAYALMLPMQNLGLHQHDVDGKTILSQKGLRDYYGAETFEGL